MTPTNEQIAETLKRWRGRQRRGRGHESHGQSVIAIGSVDAHVASTSGAAYWQEFTSEDAGNAALIVAYRNHHAAIIAALRNVGRMREALERVAAHPGGSILVLNATGDGSPMISVHTFAMDALTATGRE